MQGKQSCSEIATETYRPTLWRTCRMLANAKRLSCLKAVLEEPDLTVGEVAERINLSVCHTSETLRALQARGLISASRKSRFVRYRPLPDPLVENAKPLLTALRRALVDKPQPSAKIISTLTAFTHPRRLAILSLLQKEPSLYTTDIVARAQISPPALRRHLFKLRKREFVLFDGDRWSLAAIRDPLAKTLLSLLPVP